MNRTCTWVGAFVLIAGLHGGTAHAQPPSDKPAANKPRKDEASPAQQKVKPARKPAKPDPEAQRERVRKARERVRRARERVRKAQRAERPGRGSKGRPGTGKSPPDRPMRGMKKGAGRRMRAGSDGGFARGRRHGKRMESRRQVWRRLRQHWPVDAVSPALTAEMRRHARRMAKLHRIADIAEKQNDAKTTARVEALLERERARHRRKIEVLSKAVRARESESAGSKKGPAKAAKEEAR